MVVGNGFLIFLLLITCGPRGETTVETSAKSVSSCSSSVFEGRPQRQRMVLLFFFSLCWKLSLLKRSRNTHSVCFPNDVSKSQIAARIVLCFSCQSVLVRDVWGTFSTLFWLLWDWRRGETLMDTTQDKHKQLEIHQTNANLCDRLSVFNALYCMIL